MKKLLSIVLALAMLLTVVVMPTGAIEGTYVAYYVGDATDGDAVTGLTAGETYTPERMPTSAAPEGQYFAGWKDANGNYVLQNGMTLAEGENALYASYVDYPVEEKAYLSVEGLQETNIGTTISAPALYNVDDVETFFPHYKSEINGGYIQREFVTEGEGAPYVKYGSNKSGTSKASILLYNQDGVAYAGKYNTNYQIVVKFTVPQFNAGERFAMSANFGIRKTHPNSTSFDAYTNSNGGNVSCSVYKSSARPIVDGTELSVKTSNDWHKFVFGGSVSYEMSTESNTTVYNYIGDAGDTVHTAVFNIATGTEEAALTADVAPYFSFTIFTGQGNNWATTVEIKEISILDTSVAQVQYIANGKVENTVAGLATGETYTPDRMPTAEAPEGKYFVGWADSTGKLVTSINLEYGNNTLTAVYKDYKDEMVASFVRDNLDPNGRGGVFAPCIVNGAFDPVVNSYLGGYHSVGSLVENGETYGRIYNTTKWNYSSTNPLHSEDGSAFFAEPNSTYNFAITFRTQTENAEGEFNLCAAIGIPMASVNNEGANGWTTPKVHGSAFSYADGTVATISENHLVITGAQDWKTVNITVTTGDLSGTLPVFAIMAYTHGYSEIHIKDVTIEKAVANVQYIVGDTVESTVENLDVGSEFTPDRMPTAEAPEGKYFAGWQTADGTLVSSSVVLVEGTNTLTAVYKDYVSGSVNASLSIPSSKVLTYPTVVEGVYKGNIPYNGYARNEYVTSGSESYAKHYNYATWGQTTLNPIHDADGVPYVGKTNTTYAITFTYRVPVNERNDLSTNYSSENTSTRAGLYMYISAGYKPAMKVSADGSTDYLRNWYANSNGHDDWHFLASNDNTIGYDHGSGFPFWSDVDATDWTTETFYITTPAQDYYDQTGTIPMFAYTVTLPGTGGGNVELNIKDITITELSIHDDLQDATIAEKEAGYVKILDEVEDNATYKVTFNGNLKADGLGWSSVYALTANADNVNLNQSLIYGYNADHGVKGTMGSFGYAGTRSFTSFITTDLVAEEGNALYLYVTNTAILNQLNLISIEKVEGIAKVGAAILVDQPADATQAIRYVFSYNTVNGDDIVIDGETYKIASRGFLLADADKVGDKTVTRTTAAEKDSGIIDANTTELTKCWKYTDNGDGTVNLQFSTYVKGFKADEGTYNDTNRLYVKGYVVLTNGSVIYSEEITDTVADVANKLGLVH